MQVSRRQPPGFNGCTVGSEPWRRSLSDRILIAENRCMLAVLPFGLPVGYLLYFGQERSWIVIGSLLFSIHVEISAKQRTASKKSPERIEVGCLKRR
jgi:hypothetical protein